MSLESEVSELKTATNNLLTAVSIQKSYLDAAAASAIAGVTAQGAIVPTPAKSPLGNAQGVFSGSWIDPITPLWVNDLRVGPVGFNGGSQSRLFAAFAKSVQGVENEICRFGVGGSPNIAADGYWTWVGSEGYGNINRLGYRLSLKNYDTYTNSYSQELFGINGIGMVTIPLIRAGDGLDSQGDRHVINKSPSSSGEILYVGVNGASAPCIAVVKSSGLGDWSSAASVLYVGKNASSSRSIGAAGTVNTSGNDYAEYIFKSGDCSTILPGQIVGLTNQNEVTDKWNLALMFSIKSTEPSFVGGDVWSRGLVKPDPKAGQKPTAPIKKEDSIIDGVLISGETEEQWLEKIGAFNTLLEEYKAQLVLDKEELKAFEEALEVERQKVDRIAIAGRVPVNVLGAQPGDYIVPEQDGEGIKGVAVPEADITFAQYRKAVGRVIKILEDGRAYVMVKVV